MNTINKTKAKDVLLDDIIDINNNSKKELEKLAGCNVLFTGGAGFLGYLFLNALSSYKSPHSSEIITITVYENFSRGRKEWLDELSKKNNIELIEHDITNPIPKDAPKFDYIIHAASIASPIFYRKNPIATIDANVNGLRHLLDYAKIRQDSKAPIKGMLFFSTSEIYGDPTPDQIPTPEEYRGLVSCTGPRACYDESKRLGETLCVNFFHEYGIPVKIARPFNNFGPGLNINDRRVIPDLARDMFNGKDIVLLSNGKATRTFCYVSDAVSGYIKILINGSSGESYNIGIETPEINMLQLASKIEKIGKEYFHYNGNLVFKESDDEEYLTDNPNRRCPDISKARKDIGYDPKVSLDKGLLKSLIWYSENLS